MSVDIRLTRRGEEPWGFRLIGGKDFNMPLTVVKVQPSSPAHAAGLRNGDSLLHIDGAPSEGMSHEDAQAAIKKCGEELSMQVTRGLNNEPMLNEQEMISEPMEPEDFCPSCEPTEEEILEIERKSSLLASAIDETIKSIEEYKEQVGIDTRKEVQNTEINDKSVNEEPTLKVNGQTKSENIMTRDETFIQAVPESTPIYNGYVKEAKTIVYANVNSDIAKENVKLEEDWSKVVDQFKLNKTNSKLPEKSIKITETSVLPQKDVKLPSNVSATNSIQPTAYKTENTFENLLLSSDPTEQQTDISILPSTDTMKEESKTDQCVKPFETMQSYAYTTADKAERETTLAQETQGISTVFVDQGEINTDPVQGYRPVAFNPEEIRRSASRERLMTSGLTSVEVDIARPRSVTIDGVTMATTQGIVDGLEDVVVDADVAKELGKPGITEEKIAEIISGESEMLREAHVMGVDFKKIKPTIETLKDSEVLKALNEELTKTKDEKKKEERKWTTFLQKPKGPTPKPKFGYHGWLPQFDAVPKEQYKVKIVKQPKPKVAPDYNPEHFETGPLPWEERAANEPPPPPVAPEDPILIPEELPVFLEAVDPLPESAVPDLEETGIPLLPAKTQEVASELLKEQTVDDQQKVEEPTELDLEKVVEETQQLIIEDMEKNQLADQLLSNVQSMVDPNSTLEQQLAQMRAQLATLAQLPTIIQQSLELVTRQLMQITQQDSTQSVKGGMSGSNVEAGNECEITIDKVPTETEETQETLKQEEIRKEEEDMLEEQRGIEKQNKDSTQCGKVEGTPGSTVESSQEVQKAEETQEATEQAKPQQLSLSPEELEKIRKEEVEMIEEQKRIEQQNKELMEQMQLEQESRRVKEHSMPRVGRPKPVFGPLTPQERPLVLPGGRKWRKPKDAYNEAFIAETLTAQAEIIQGKTKGPQFESYLLPYDQRVNFLKYEKPPVLLDHLKDSDTFKMIHNMELAPPRRVDLLTPVIAESDYREVQRVGESYRKRRAHLCASRKVALTKKCRSLTPCLERRVPQDDHLDMPQQLQP